MISYERMKVKKKLSEKESFPYERKKVLIFIVAYNAEKTIQDILHRINIDRTRYDPEILIIDDASPDTTFEQAYAESEGNLPYKLTILKNPINQGYGGNQKLGYYYAILQKFDIVVLLHGDGQYAPEYLNVLVDSLVEHQADAVFGSRMLKPGEALKGGMPVYKFLGNKILTFIQNRLLNTQLSEFHSGYRVYAVSALEKIPFEYNSNDFHFDTQIIIQLIAIHAVIQEVPIPTYYGDEICHVNGLRYAWNVLKTTVAYRLHTTGIFYQHIYDVQSHIKYTPKLTYASSHSYAIAAVPRGVHVCDVACGQGYIAKILQKEKNCTVYGVDLVIPEDRSPFQAFYHCDLNRDELPDVLTECDYVLLLDVLEHLQNPEKFLQQLRTKCHPYKTTMVCSVPNVAFFPLRLMLLVGQFNYGKEGILDKTHTRLFTFGSCISMLEQNGFRIEQVQGIPAPFPKAIGENWLSHVLVHLNRLAIRFCKGVFSYQIFLRARPLPTCEFLLQQSLKYSDSRKQDILQSQ